MPFEESHDIAGLVLLHAELTHAKRSEGLESKISAKYQPTRRSHDEFAHPSDDSDQARKLPTARAGSRVDCSQVAYLIAYEWHRIVVQIRDKQTSGCSCGKADPSPSTASTIMSSA